MKLSKKLLADNLLTTTTLFRKLLDNEAFFEDFELAVKTILNAYRNNGRLYIAGNGGSASDANHLAGEFVGRYKKDRPPIPAESLNSDVSVITCIGNDFGYDQIFLRQLMAKMQPNDVFLAISTSGNSQNIINALAYTKLNEMTSILLSGNDGGQAKELATVSLIVPHDNTAIIQQAHIAIYHTIINYIEQELLGNY